MFPDRVNEVRRPLPAARATIGISAIAVYEPPWVLGNDWFNGSLPRKFVQHTGIRSRRISQEDEVTMGVRAMDRLRDKVHYDLRDCVAVIFVSPSLVPVAFAREFLPESRVLQESPNHLARQFANRLGVAADYILGINWFCSGYPKALSLVHDHILPKLALRENQFMLVVTVSRISRITDYGCPQTAPLFGDMATVTVLSRTDSQKYPVHLSLVRATAEARPADAVLFDFHCRQNVLVPTSDGGSARDPHRLVFSMNGLGIGDAAPRAMAHATGNALRTTGILPEDVQFVVPHQAGSGMVRLTAMKLDDIGVRGEVVNGLTSEIGNVSSCSIPYALKKRWWGLRGTIACPSAGVGPPGEATVSQGCVLLRTKPCHKYNKECDE